MLLSQLPLEVERDGVLVHGLTAFLVEAGIAGGLAAYATECLLVDAVTL